MVKNLNRRIGTSVILILLLFLMLLNNYVLGYFLLIVSVFSLLEFSKMIKKIFPNSRFKQLIFCFFFIFYIFGFGATLLIFSNFIHLKILLFLLILTCVASDIGGFIFGKLFKGPKLTKISPNKTISGSVGSLIFSGLFILASFYFLTKNINFEIIVVGFITSFACQVGDLFFSFLKRKSFLKDTGNYLPGHGGILDRIDGILLGVPIGFLNLLLFF